MKVAIKQLVEIKADAALLEGMLVLPDNARGLVLFVHGSGSRRHSPRNNYVAQILHERHMATLLMDLLTPQEDQDYHKRFDIDLLTRRTLSATRWARSHKPLQHLLIGYFGASTGAAAALQAAAQPDVEGAAVVSRGGRPDLAGRDDLAKVKAPTLLLVGSLDTEVIALNRQAYVYLQCTKELAIIEGATHLFEEPGTLQEVARVATSWFSQHLQA
jgi:putative phosphoribosyl transferase